MPPKPPETPPYLYPDTAVAGVLGWETRTLIRNMMHDEGARPREGGTVDIRTVAEMLGCSVTLIADCLAGRDKLLDYEEAAFGLGMSTRGLGYAMQQQHPDLIPDIWASGADGVRLVRWSYERVKRIRRQQNSRERMPLTGRRLDKALAASKAVLKAARPGELPFRILRL